MDEIKRLSAVILVKYTNDQLTDPTILDPGDACDKLLQVFHRFDEGLSVKGKWQGGSVTGVCRGWGTNKVRAVDIFITWDCHWSGKNNFHLVRPLVYDSRVNILYQ